MVFNLFITGFSCYYLVTIIRVKKKLDKDLLTTIQQIIVALNGFRKSARYLNIPIVIIGVMAFVVVHDLISWLPWMIIEFFLWRWVLLPSGRRRFDNFISDLEFSVGRLTDNR
jgi:hypothetical protein